MTKKKKDQRAKKLSKKDKAADRKKKRYLAIVGSIVIIAVAVIIIFTGNDKNNTSPNIRSNNIVKGYTSFDFRKEGELTFNSSEGGFISKIDIEIADDEESRTTGLMYRDKMAENQGMLFIFPQETYQSFWMRNTLISLDFLFVNSKGEIVKIHKYTKPFEDEISYPSDAPAIYVVEVIGGYTDTHNIKEGDKIVWRRN